MDETDDWRKHLHMLPEHMQQSMRDWLGEGEPHPKVMGSFLIAVLTNDLLGAFARADMQNAASMRHWAEFLTSFAPPGSYGTMAELLAWHEARHGKRWGWENVNVTVGGTVVGPPLVVDDRVERVTVEMRSRAFDLLRVLGDPAEVLARLADHAQQGVYRPGSWERGWIMQAFGDEFTAKLERDPDAPYFQRPKVRPK